MKELIKNIIRKTPLYPALRVWKWERKAVREWEKAGKPVPPPHEVKQRVLRQYSRKHRLKVLVETGTYLGDMIQAMQPYFDQIYSIELSDDLFQKARQRFANAGSVNLSQGDSGVELRNVLKQLRQPALFWLDGHYSDGFTAKGDKQTPIYQELNWIFSVPERRHVIIIDDARCFGVTADYPTLAELKSFVEEKRPGASFVVKDDSIRITQS